jgi:hypothetical protein
MAAQVRTDKKAAEVFKKIMGTPAYMVDRKTKRQKEIDRILSVQNSMHTTYR